MGEAKRRQKVALQDDVVAKTVTEPETVTSVT
jgi:hypothetical protein